MRGARIWPQNGRKRPELNFSQLFANFPQRSRTRPRRKALDDGQQREFEEELELNLAISEPGIGRFRVNVFKQRNQVSMVIRNIQTDLPHFADLGLPHVLTEVIMAKRGLILFVGGIVLFVFGVQQYRWYITELNAIFLAIGLGAAILSRMRPNEASATFIRGAGEMTAAALLIGFARTIEVVLSEGQIIDTIINAIAGTLEGTGAYVSAVGMLAVQTICNLFIPSGSGQAYVTMPIMAPLADLVGVTRQVAVLAYQFGDGFTNIAVPTNPVIMGMLAMARIPYDRWLRFVFPFLLKIWLVASVALAVAVAIGYS